MYCTDHVKSLYFHAHHVPLSLLSPSCAHAYFIRIMAGCTAVVALQIGNQLFVANAGTFALPQ